MGPYSNAPRPGIDRYVYGDGLFSFIAGGVKKILQKVVPAHTIVGKLVGAKPAQTAAATAAGVVAGQALAHLYQNVRLYVNYFQPSFKLLGKKRNGAKVTRSYDLPATPCERLLRHPAVDGETKEKLESERQRLDPVELLYRIREGQAALTALVSEDSSAEGPGRKTLDEFLSQLPKLWRSGEVRPTHGPRPTKPRHWRTRKDPFETVWFDVLRWLQHAPDSTAKALFERLQREHPGRFPDGQLRTFQRRVREWRQVMARKLVYACIGENGEPSEAKAMGTGRTR